MSISIHLQELSCSHDDVALFQPLTHHFAPCAVYRIAGDNGAGKTTLLRSLAGLFQGTSGTIEWLNTQPSSSAAKLPQAERRANLLYIGHKGGIKLGLTPLENLRWLTEYQIADKPLLDALDRVGLYGYEFVPAAKLSAGQKRRVALARLYVSQHPVWILDEPLTALDKAAVESLTDFFRQEAERGRLVILTTHQSLPIDDLVTVKLEHVPCD
ncbi:cytochrome c biogenesis heme-transporting ATPase CcmA [Umboniibacter marinipuniceus]|uniref:Heme exporter protein A n=1 Tax=Umboniibacter marinipuniceus TaxID=569599 RepID=A0A3M0A8W1_9GAMM|nr:cytochrome c biogenesis heme-transporting ATPase CcmA [Umboniibacter marinipuniceus]RMA81300.1 heme exporter protein A [Umboniibacter marinipuniceus]